MIFDIGWEVTIPAIGLRPKGQGQNLATNRGRRAAFQPEELRKRTLRPQCVRNLAYLALEGNRQFSLVKPSMRDALRGVFHVACLVSVFD